MNNFAAGMKLTLGYEGGKSDRKNDRGKLTMFGLTQGTYDRWRRNRGLDVRSVTLVEPEELETVFRDEFWVAAHCDLYPLRLAQCVFDAAINHSPVEAIKLLQQALGLKDDGLFGVKTCTAAADCDEQVTIAAYLDARQDFFDAIIKHDPSQLEFKNGWHNRILKLRAALLDQPVAEAL